MASRSMSRFAPTLGAPPRFGQRLNDPRQVQFGRNLIF